MTPSEAVGALAAALVSSATGAPAGDPKAFFDSGDNTWGHKAVVDLASHSWEVINDQKPGPEHLAAAVAITMAVMKAVGLPFGVDYEIGSKVGQVFGEALDVIQS